MKVELTPDAAQWVEAELAELRAELQAAEAEGGSFTTDEVRRFARAQFERVPGTPNRGA